MKNIWWAIGIAALIVWVFNKSQAAQRAGTTFTATPPQRGTFGSGTGLYAPAQGTIIGGGNAMFS